ncbi:MAG: hypothetical protein WBK97_05745 [Bacteroidales bacterium]|jgi:dihydroxyacetone kinase-like predicted kinase
MKKILINKRELEANSVVLSLKKQVEYLNENILPELAELGIKFSSKILADLLFNNCQMIQEEYSKQIEEDLKEVKNPILRKSHLSVTQDAMFEFLEKARSIGHVQKKDFLSVKNGQVVLTAENEKMLRESYYYYLTDPEEIQKHEQLQAICDALNAFFVGKPFGYWFDYFELEDGKYIPKDTLNYSEVMRRIRLKQ